jgi:hypothetical protein
VVKRAGAQLSGFRVRGGNAGAIEISYDRSSASTGGVLRVTPKTGMALLFHHPISHRGDPVIAGRKYVLRTDVMYARPMRIVETDA